MKFEPKMLFVIAIAAVLVLSGCVAGAAGPKDTYMQYKAEFDSMKNFNDMISLGEKYGTKEQVAKVKQTVALIPEESRELMFSMIMQVAPKAADMTELVETIDGDSATLTGGTKNGSMNVTIKMKKENSAWKIDEETWTPAGTEDTTGWEDTECTADSECASDEYCIQGVCSPKDTT